MIKIFIYLITVFFSTIVFADESKDKNLKIFTGEWVSECLNQTTNPKKKCILERAMYLDKKLEKKLIIMQIQNNFNSQDLLFTLVGPLGTSIKSGVKIGVNNELLSKKPFGFNYCIKSGCVTSFLINQSTLELFKKSKKIDVEYELRSKQKMKISLSLDGFSDAFDKIK